MKSSTSALLITALAALTLGTGCGSDHSPTSPISAHDTLALSQIAPAVGNTVPVDAVVRFDATVGYEFASATSGRLGAVVIATGGEGEIEYLTSRELQQLPSRRGDVTVSFDVSLPRRAARSSLAVIFNAYREGSSAATAQVRATYKVGP